MNFHLNKLEGAKHTRIEFDSIRYQGDRDFATWLGENGEPVWIDERPFYRPRDFSAALTFAGTMQDGGRMLKALECMAVDPGLWLSISW